MSSPVKKRKKNDAGTTGFSRPNRTIESFFARPSLVPRTEQTPPALPTCDVRERLTDEELACKLQSEWDQEILQLSEAASDMESSLEPKPEKQGNKETLALQRNTDFDDSNISGLPLDQAPLLFDSSIHLKDLKTAWNINGGYASYSLLSYTFSLINSTQSRIKIIDILVNLLRLIIEGDPKSLIPAVWLATNSIAPPHVPLELGIGGSSLSKALKNAYGLADASLKALYTKYGDAGDVAFEAKKRQTFTLRKPKPLSIRGVFETLIKIAETKGTGSQEMKQRLIEKLLQDTRSTEESRYIVRTLVQHLRIGAVKATMLTALARAFLYSKPPSATYRVRHQGELAAMKKEELARLYSEAEELVRACYSRRPDYNILVQALLEVGTSKQLLTQCRLQLHTPVLPMLGSITRDLPQMLTKLQDRSFSCEFKYDGQRAQVHCDDSGKISVFSRHLESMTEKYPDLVSIVPAVRGEDVSSFILEGEIVAINQESGELLPFQTLSNRARKNVEIGNIKVSVCLFAFDLMFLNGESLLDRPFRERRSLLRGLFVEISKKFCWAKSLDATSSDSEPILNFYKEATASKCEGIMVKVLDEYFSEKDPKEDTFMTLGTEMHKPFGPGSFLGAKGKDPKRKALLSTYEPDKRLESWLKVKKDYNTSSDTLDLIPVAAWHGQGRKVKWWSPILLAVRNPETGTLEAVTKCMSGFTDKFYQENRGKYSEESDNLISRPSYIDYIGEPEVWFEPQEVWEIAFADITLSPTYTAAIGLVSEDRGLSLRFPRFLQVREDKSIEDSSTSDLLAQLWQRQEDRGGTATN